MEIYELLREEVAFDPLVALLYEHALKDSIVVEREGEDKGSGIVGCAFFLHILDPYDLGEGPIQEDPRGKYLYFPLLYIKPEHRDKGVLRALLKQAFKKTPQAHRMAYLRGRKLHVLRRVLNGNNRSRDSKTNAVL